jgi:protein-disulfide isomerase
LRSVRSIARISLILLALAAAGVLAATSPASDRVGRYFEEWFPYFPGASVAVVPVPDLSLPGLDAFRADHRSSSQAHQESNVALSDGAAQEIFVGDVFGDPRRRGSGRPFTPATDLPNIQSSLQEALGLAVRVSSAPGPAHGVLRPLAIGIRQRGDAVLNRPAFVSEDGSVLAIGEFRPASESPRAFRQKLLAEQPGIRVGSGKALVAEFIDFQCERCRARAPEIEKVAASYGGSVEAHFLPLVRFHDWAFTAAEAAMALASIDPALYAKYRAAVFASAGSLNEAGCRDLAADVAESAGVGARYRQEIANGRARDRVLADQALAARLGVVITPTFVHDGMLVSGEAGLLENRLFERLGRPPAAKKP